MDFLKRNARSIGAATLVVAVIIIYLTSGFDYLVQKSILYTVWAFVFAALIVAIDAAYVVYGQNAPQGQGLLAYNQSVNRAALVATIISAAYLSLAMTKATFFSQLTVLMIVKIAVGTFALVLWSKVAVRVVAGASVGDVLGAFPKDFYVALTECLGFAKSEAVKASSKLNASDAAAGGGPDGTGPVVPPAAASAETRPTDQPQQ